MSKEHPGSPPRQRRVLGYEYSKGNPLPKGKSRTEVQRARDYSIILEKHVKGHSAERIADDMGLSPNTIRKDLKHIRESQAGTLDSAARGYVAIQLHRLQYVLGQALDGFETSKVAGKITLTKLPDGSTAERTEYQPGGDVKYLNTAKSTVESMNRLLGLDNTPTLHQTNVTVDASSLLAQPMSVEDYVQATQPRNAAPPAPRPTIVKETLTSPSGSVVTVNSLSVDGAEPEDPIDKKIKAMENGW